MAVHPDRVFPSPAQKTLLREVRLRLIEEDERPRFDALLQSEHYLHDATQEVPLAGTLVTADALHTQTDTARHLVQERGADYLLVVKDNQPSLREQCARLFPEPAFSPYTFAVRKRPRTHRDPRSPRSYGSHRRTALSRCRTSSSCGPPPRVLQRHHRAGDRLCHHQPLR